MQRNIEMIRKVLLAIQARSDMHPQELSIDGEDDFTVRHHVAILYAEGFINGSSFETSDVPYKAVYISDLTWAGHDIVAVLANDKVWSKITSSIDPVDLAGLPLSVINSVGTGLLDAWAKQSVGL